ncbi:MAG TPA: UDP-N-acetylmuramoyl-tripeptide--D-alanyl-D-alanine ligase [Thermoanaerobaculia bacterium]|nr:UDP-N-acetylmuramoyl-tripeptide--D-alanyl-D-alanine ligase [Thermoanaerobaculia bacterium]
MARLTVEEIARAANGRIVSGDPRSECSGAAIDSRKIEGGEIFFALPGTRTDGHRFVGTAAAQGAGAVVVQEDVSAETAIIRVEDSLKALQDLARHVRASGVPQKLVGITGSMGKTTTKELLAAMLGSRFRTSKTIGNLNNLIGYPLSLLNVPDGTEWMVAEMGMSTAGELRELSLMGRPDAAVFTVVRPVHLEFFASVSDIAEAKSELLAGLAPDGPVIANADDPEVTRIAKRHGKKVVWYGVESSAVDVRLTDLAPGPEGAGSRFRIHAGGQAAGFELPLHGLYNAENCLAAAACAWALGMSLEEIAASVREVKPASMRGVVHRGGFTLVDDSYNSNPAALAKALESAARLPVGPGRRRVAVLGDMRELGPEGPRFHRESGEVAARLGFSPILGVGELSRELTAGARAAGAEAHWVADAAAAAEWAAKQVQLGDLVLVKASRGVGLDAVVRRLIPDNRPGSGEEAH